MSYFNSSSVITPHDYQLDAMKSFLVGMFKIKIRRQLIILPTGTGKTILFSFLAGWFALTGKRVLILAHRDRLIEQAGEKAGRIGLKLAVEKASRRALEYVTLGSRIVVGSVQTMKGRRLDQWPKETFHLIIIDEAHHATASGYQAILDHFDSAFVLGVTATDRAKKGQLKRVFERIAYQMTIRQAIVNEHLVPIIGVRGDVKVDLRGITSKGGDFDIGQLDERISEVIEPLALATRKEIGTRKTMVFTPDIKTSQAFAKAMCDIGVNAKATWGVDPRQAETLQAFENDEFQVLCNCSLLTEGFDCPPVSAIVIARPTKSSTLLMQMFGRGTRLYPGKADCLGLDFGWVVDSDNVQTLVDLFADEETNESDLKRAKKLLETNKEHDPIAALEKAQQIREAKEAAAAEKERNQAKIKIKDRSIDYKRMVFDPFRVRQILNVRSRHPTEGTISMPASVPTTARLKKLGYQDTKGLTQREADEVQDKITLRRQCGMTSLKQITFLARQGYDPAKVAEMTSDQAQALIGPTMAGFQKRHG